MLSILCVTLTIKLKAGIPGSFKVGWYREKITGSSHLKTSMYEVLNIRKIEGLRKNMTLCRQLSHMNSKIIK